MWNGNVFSSKVSVKVNVMLLFLVLPAKPTRVEFFGVIVARPTEAYFDDVWSLLSTMDFGMSCFSVMLTIRNDTGALLLFLLLQVLPFFWLLQLTSEIQVFGGYFIPLLVFR